MFKKHSDNDDFYKKRYIWNLKDSQLILLIFLAQAHYKVSVERSNSLSNCRLQIGRILVTKNHLLYEQIRFLITKLMFKTAYGSWRWIGWFPLLIRTRFRAMEQEIQKKVYQFHQDIFWWQTYKRQVRCSKNFDRACGSGLYTSS